jgi:hypothetical protein
MQASAASTRFLAGFLCEILVDRPKERPEPGSPRQIVIHGRVLRSPHKPRSTPLGKLDPVIRLFEGNFLASNRELAQESRISRRLPWPRTGVVKEVVDHGASHSPDAARRQDRRQWLRHGSIDDGRLKEAKDEGLGQENVVSLASATSIRPPLGPPSTRERHFHLAATRDRFGSLLLRREESPIRSVHPNWFSAVVRPFSP